MTEAEWLACTDPTPMLEFLNGRASNRKLRLFACACCRRYWHLLRDERSQKVVEAAESFADGATSLTRLDAARSDASRVHTLGLPFNATRHVADSDAFDAAWEVSSHLAQIVARDPDAEQKAQGDLLREIFDNPFRSTTVDPCWLTTTVIAISQAVYNERAFNRLPTLADALEDAGCDNDDLLSHCRSGGEHVRGCWVVDLLLDKE